MLRPAGHGTVSGTSRPDLGRGWRRLHGPGLPHRACMRRWQEVTPHPQEIVNKSKNRKGESHDRRASVSVLTRSPPEDTGPKVRGSQEEWRFAGVFQPFSVHRVGSKSGGAGAPFRTSVWGERAGFPPHSCKIQSRGWSPNRPVSVHEASSGNATCGHQGLDCCSAGVHHTSRNRELLDLEWKGSDHIRRRSPFK